MSLIQNAYRHVSYSAWGMSPEAPSPRLMTVSYSVILLGDSGTFRVCGLKAVRSLEVCLWRIYWDANSFPLCDPRLPCPACELYGHCHLIP